MQSPFKTKPSFPEVGIAGSIPLSGQVPLSGKVPLAGNIPLANGLIGAGFELTNQLHDILRGAFATSPKLAIEILAAVVSGLNPDVVAQMPRATKRELRIIFEKGLDPFLPGPIRRIKAMLHMAADLLDKLKMGQTSP